MTQMQMPKGPLISASNISVFIIRIIGLLVLVVGVFIALKVIGEAWNLYDEPQRITRFAVQVEEGSNLDRVLAFKAKGMAPDEALAGTDRLGIPSQDDAGEIVFRLSYFAAWSIVFLLLLLLGRLAMAAIKTGGELALYDIQAKQFARTLLDQVKKTPPPAAAPQQPVEPAFTEPKLGTPVSHKMSDAGHRRPRR